MGRRGDGYGSQDHLLFYRTSLKSALLDDQVLKAIQARAGARIHWRYPVARPTESAREPEGMAFLDDRPDIVAKWRDFWPQRGKQPAWDGVAQLRVGGRLDQRLLFEAKANTPSFVVTRAGRRNSAAGRKSKPR